MPIYEFACPEGHKFEAILPMSESDKPRECPKHHKESPRVDYSGSSWQWGVEDVRWDAGLSSNPRGLSRK
jgi:putative FmdB family regulatory protein